MLVGVAVTATVLTAATPTVMVTWLLGLAGVVELDDPPEPVGASSGTLSHAASSVTTTASAEYFKKSLINPSPRIWSRRAPSDRTRSLHRTRRSLRSGCWDPVRTAPRATYRLSS